jgi:hypothetical protein
MPFLRTHEHFTEIVLSGVTYARVIKIINGYTLTFEDGQYAVNLTGANSNLAEVANVNQVSVRSNNSAGLIKNPCITEELEQVVDLIKGQDDRDNTEVYNKVDEIIKYIEDKGGALSKTTINALITKTEARLELWYKAEEALITQGYAQSYTIGNRTLTKIDAGIIAKMIDELEKKCLKLGHRGYIRLKRVVPRDC